MVSYLSTVRTPRKHDHGIICAQNKCVVLLTQRLMIGTCVVVITMLATFYARNLPGIKPRLYSQSDVATFDRIHDGAMNISSKCVRRKLEPDAGWSCLGKCVNRSMYASSGELDLHFNLYSRTHR